MRTSMEPLLMCADNVTGFRLPQQTVSLRQHVLWLKTGLRVVIDAADVRTTLLSRKAWTLTL